MKVVYSSWNVLSVKRGFSLLIIHFLVAIAFGSYEVEHPQETVENNIRDADFLRLKREIIDALKTNAQNIRDADFIRLKSEVVDALKTEKKSEEDYGGAFYIRWGRTKCPRGSDDVYKGVAGGSWWDSTGGGSNYLCLPLDPIWGTYNEGTAKWSRIYGSEYEYGSGFGLKNNGQRPLHNYNVPCIACRSQSKTSVMMLPARNQCYNGWRTEYSGYLMAEYYGQKGRTEYICVDGEPESDPAGFKNEDGALMYNVEGVCGSLPCPPYVPRRELTCAVCTK